jgi:hypothetical protein
MNAESLLDVIAGALETGAPVVVERDGATRAYVTDREGGIVLVTTQTIAQRRSPPTSEADLERALAGFFSDLER